jgi:drug/metabolite transporter (DMT)-like permease
MEEWIIISIGLLVSSVALYLVVRKSNNVEMSVDIQNLGMFLLPTIFIGLYILFKNESLEISIINLLIIIFAAIFFSWLGNIASLKALKKAPNPGYSLVISKSYVLMTSIVSVWIFHSPLTLKSIIAIVLIIIFSAVIIIDRKKLSDISNNIWIWFTVGAFFAWGFLALTLKYLTSNGMKSVVILFYLMLFVSILVLSQIIFKKVKIIVTKEQKFIFLFIGIASTFFNLFNILGYQYAPNPGYINAVNAGSIALVTIFAAIFFRDDLSIKKIIGVLGVVASLVLLFI